ncbi:MAG: phasin family protein [Candidatus Obscuribacterales bacterium]|nr:phasin family protein [Candidatus Obscuribacterales bacterium]
MSERTKLLKKAVLTGVGASTNIERVKSALNEALEDLVKVGHELMDDLEVKGKDKTESIEKSLKSFTEEVNKRKGTLEVQVTASIKKAIKEFGLMTREDLEELHERIEHLEDTLCDGSESGDATTGTTPARKAKRRGK